MALPPRSLWPSGWWRADYCCALCRLKYIFLTGHLHLLHGVHGRRDPDGCRLRGVGLVITGSLILGLIMAFFPALRSAMKRITGNDEIAFGHFGTLGYVLSGWIGSKVRKGSRSTEEMNLPKNLSFLRDSSISISLTMMIIYLIMAVSAGREYGGGHLQRRPNYLDPPSLWPSPSRQACSSSCRACAPDSGGNRPGLYRLLEKLVPNARPALTAR